MLNLSNGRAELDGRPARNASQREAGGGDPPAMLRGYCSKLSNKIFVIYLVIDHERSRMDGATGLEPAASCSQSKRATNCATPR